MALIVGGTTIPTSGDFIKVGNTNVDKVVCNGVTVWEKVKDFYIWENGSPYPSYNPSSFVRKASERFDMNFERRNGNYGMTVSNIYTSGGRDFCVLACGFTIPDINTSNCSKIKIVSDTYLDDKDGGRTWYTYIYGIKDDGSVTELKKAYVFGTELECSISGYSKVRIKIEVECGIRGGTENHCSGCTVGYYINSIFIKK